MRPSGHLPAIVWSALSITVLVSCGPLSGTRAPDVDLMPPHLQSVQSIGPGEISVSFDEDAGLSAEKTRISPALVVREVTGPARSVLLRGQEQEPGLRYLLESEARDARGNSASFVAEFYGYNSRVPRLLINELTPRGSGNHPDVVELKAVTAGNMGGAVLYLGSPASYDARLVFPPFEVAAGSFLVVHLKPAGDPGEVDERGDMAASTGFDAADTAYDFWMRDGKGLGGNNGVVSLFDRPGGTCLDGVLYSNRTAESDELYGGFGSAEMRARAEELAACGAWVPSGTRITPEDGVNPEGSTGTRSLCRSSESDDTNSARDWHIVPTRRSTIGVVNSDEVYVPRSNP
jgi:hypothetical protein